MVELYQVRCCQSHTNPLPHMHIIPLVVTVHTNPLVDTVHTTPLVVTVHSNPLVSLCILTPWCHCAF